MARYLNPADIDPFLLMRMSRKADSSTSQYHLACAAFDRKGELLGITTNSFRRNMIAVRKYSGYHCEMKAIHRWGSKIKSMVLLRIGNAGDILPIDCCPKCANVIQKMGIKVMPIRLQNS